ncbi:trafficking protein particle complex subunit 12-like [Dreissena polymorpha]|uniref:Trafficking protein particle complex subunit 12 n=1 Tax=Dreissena polymorpha TaxID=45954 RepID=A0A9D4IHH2_DREPO|nr:trafficking protein particle complex subunit 12-like [Dreissena polymorpha]XP_052230516.1 trafficking protein particle complex subunit 12-like [Dreissena polymorpha]XP_052230517.1 trafficking protein particle complex subunit 12-like [Dreissena polymorpha]KAH3775656.1 hypothetical protein DPMN_177062 [Dreissena polymorpha]
MSQDPENDNVADFLADETEEEKIFRELTSHHNLSPGTGMRHSETTDTLDSVYLEPTVTELTVDVGSKANEEQSNISTNFENTTVREGAVNHSSEHKSAHPVGEIKQLPEVTVENIVFSVGDQQAEANSPPSLSKYFGKDSNTDDPFDSNFFSSLPHIEENLPAATSIENIIHEIETEEFGTASNKINENTDAMADLTLKDNDELLRLVEEATKNVTPTEENLADYYSTEQEKNDFERTESVDFDLALDNTEPVETPVDIEEKDRFESFTAEMAENEALDALGISPAAPSSMNEKNMTEYFRQTSNQSEGLFNHLARQSSQLSGFSSSSQEKIVSTTNLEEETDSEIGVPASVENSDTRIPAPELPESEPAKVESTPIHQPVFPPSTTLSPVESSAHQHFFKHSDSLTSTDNSINTFQNLTDDAAGDDNFFVTLQMSDSDRQHDSWLPSETTKSILIAMATHVQGSYIPDRGMLVTPGLVVTQPQGDPVRDLVYKYMGEQEAMKRKVPTISSVTRDVDGLVKLMQAGCYRAAIDMTTQLLTDIGQSIAIAMVTPTTHSPKSLQIWHCRFSLMMKLRMYSILESEFAAFKTLDTPDIYYEFYPTNYPGKRGSMVPFGMRLLHAELPYHLGRPSETLDRFYYLLSVIQKILKNLGEGHSEDGSAITISTESRAASQKLWLEREKQVLYSIANVLTLLKNYDAGLSVYKDLLEKDTEHRLALLSGIGRIHLQIGNLNKANEYFQMVKDTEIKTNVAMVAVHMNRGFEAMCQNNFTEAYQCFKLALQLEPLNTSAANNMSVCCLYLGKLKEALTSLEAIVHNNPDRNLHEGILFNLCTLYELESSRALHKKQALLDLISKHKGDGFPVVCLKMA